MGLVVNMKIWDGSGSELEEEEEEEEEEGCYGQFGSDLVGV